MLFQPRRRSTTIRYPAVEPGLVESTLFVQPSRVNSDAIYTVAAARKSSFSGKCLPDPKEVSLAG
jgi:hypothetical protein